MKKYMSSIAVTTVLASNIAFSTLAMGDVKFGLFATGVSSMNYNFVVSGSYFAMDTDANNAISLSERVAMAPNDGILTSAQIASGSHSGSPGCVPNFDIGCNNSGESPGLDVAWDFLGNTGMHSTTAAPVVFSQSGDTGQIGMQGWGLIWNGNPRADLGGGGPATVVCAPGSGCAAGSAYTLDYSTFIPVGDPSGLGGASGGGGFELNASDDSLSAPLTEPVDGRLYTLHLEGFLASDVISNVPIPASIWLFGTGLLCLVGVARRKIP